MLYINDLVLTGTRYLLCGTDINKLCSSREPPHIGESRFTSRRQDNHIKVTHLINRFETAALPASIISRLMTHQATTSSNPFSFLARSPKCTFVTVQTTAKAPEDPRRQGYPDPSYFGNSEVQSAFCDLYLENLNAYGRNLSIVIEDKGQFWPKWMNTSLHEGLFPNNLDAGAEFMLLMVSAIYNYTGGTIPTYLEVINEPDTLWQHVTWDTMILYHKIVAKKLHDKFPYLKVGGPTMTGAIELSDQKDFEIWQNVRQFLDTSLVNLDFFSFHPYDFFYSEGEIHHFTGINEARLVAVIDLVESYANTKTGNSVPLIVSEYGLDRIYQDSTTPASLVQWAYAFLHNAYMFTFLNHRGVMEKAVSFLLNNNGDRFVNASLFYTNGSATSVASTYLFWKNFNDSHQFLRIDSQYDGLVRKISPLTTIDTLSGRVAILLHNYEQSTSNVKLYFDQNWVHPTSAQSTCLYLDFDKRAVLSTTTIPVSGNVVTLPPEGSCFFTFDTDYNLDTLKTVNEMTFYAPQQAVRVINRTAQASINVPKLDEPVYIHLRFGVSISNRTAQTRPTSVYLSTNLVSEHFSLYDPDRPSSATLWDVYNYHVPTSALVVGNNIVRMEFDQEGGYVSSIVLLIGIVG